VAGRVVLVAVDRYNGRVLRRFPPLLQSAIASLMKSSSPQP
jgi:hypothetical protein